jgi:hypothetical protein
MAVTAHYITRRDGHLSYETRLVALRYIPGAHTGANLANHLHSILLEINAIHKVASLTRYFLSN